MDLVFYGAHQSSLHARVSSGGGDLNKYIGIDLVWLQSNVRGIDVHNPKLFCIYSSEVIKNKPKGGDSCKCKMGTKTVGEKADPIKTCPT